jgi:hypothetical protein
MVLANRRGVQAVEIGMETSIGKIEEYFGRKATRFLLLLIYMAIAAVCISAVATYFVIPAYNILHAPKLDSAFWRAQVSFSSPLTTILLIAMIVYFIFVDNPTRRLEHDNEVLRGLIEQMRLADAERYAGPNSKSDQQ